MNSSSPSHLFHRVVKRVLANQRGEDRHHNHHPHTSTAGRPRGQVKSAVRLSEQKHAWAVIYRRPRGRFPPDGVFFSLRNNTKPKQESFEFKAPQAPPPQPPTQVSPQVMEDAPSAFSFHVSIKHPGNLRSVPSPSCPHPHLSPRTSTQLFCHPNIYSSSVPSCIKQSSHPPTPLQGQTKCIYIYLFISPPRPRLTLYLLPLSEPMH